MSPDERSLRNLALDYESRDLAGGAWRIAGTVGGVVLGGVLLFAAWLKILDPVTFSEAIHAEGLDFALSARGTALLAIGLEVAIGALLLLGIRRTPVLLAATALVALFLFLTGRTYVLHLRGAVPETHSCGCFGTLVERTPAEAFWQDAALLVPALVLAWVGRPPTWFAWPLRRLAVASGVTLAALLLAAVAPSLPLDDLATKLSPGVNVADVCAGRGDKKACVLDVIPLLAEGRHLVVLPDLADPAFQKRIAEFNDHEASGAEPTLWVLSSEPDPKLDEFKIRKGASFHLQSAPAILLRPLYRRLPRSFLVENGRVVRTWAEIPRVATVVPQGNG
jgi:uncharacterized membrane protein YphA (DoxX/SURF4 family)